MEELCILFNVIALTTYMTFIITMHTTAPEPIRPPSLLRDDCRLSSLTFSFHHQYLGLGTDEGSAVGRLLLADKLWGAVDGGVGLFSHEGS